MEESTHDKVREIKKSLRLAMNGVVSTLQRRQGLDYKINFGVEIPRLKGIAEAHAKDKELAETLWQDNIRECKMLAIFLMPESGAAEVADRWIAETKFTEIADQLAMHLLCRLPDAWDKALRWSAMREGLYAYCGYLTISHLVRKGVEPTNEQEAKFFCNLTCLKEERSIADRCALNAAMNYLDRRQGAAARLKESVADHTTTLPANITALLENFEE
jgi:hypothetical protein